MARKKDPAGAPLLNPEQQAVSLHVNGPLLVSAGAGSGKTTAVVERIVNLMRNNAVPSHRILMLSFSQTAAKEVGKRLKARLPDNDLKSVFRTFHSLALEIHKHEVHDQTSVLDHNMAITRYAFKACRDRVDGGRAVTWESFKLFASMVKNDFLGRNPVFAQLGATDPRMGALADRVAAHCRLPSAGVLLDLYYAYEHARRQGTEVKLAKDADPQVVRWTNFDELLYDVAWMLANPDVRQRWQQQWDYVIQDEAQDMCETQNVIAEYLAEQHRNYMVVGDPGQAIYEWRGARPEKLISFKDRWKNSRIIALDRNYRSGKSIIEGANAMLRSLRDYEKLPIQLRGERPDNGFMVLHEFESFDKQADAIAANCKAHHRAGVEWKEMAVLVRTVGQAGAIEVALNAADIPTKSVGSSMFDVPEVRTLFAWYRVALGKATAEHYHDALQYPYSNRVGRDFADLATKEPPPENVSWLDHIESFAPKARIPRAVDSWLDLVSKFQREGRSQTPGQLLLRISREACSDIISDAVDDVGDRDADENHKKLIDLASDFESHDLFLDKIDRMLANREKHKRTRNVVIISTVHRAKGEEWSVVFVPGVSQGVFPHKKGEAEEEKRIFYVALTRARDELWLSRAVEDMYGETLPSQFVETLGLQPQAEFRPGVQRRDRTQMTLI